LTRVFGAAGTEQEYFGLKYRHRHCLFRFQAKLRNYCFCTREKYSIAAIGVPPTIYVVSDCEMKSDALWETD
jgi:hypothetical protein